MNTKNYAVIKLASNVKSYPTFTKHTKGWINYDRDNLLPQRIIELNNESAVNRAVIENKVTYICGSGLKDSEYYAQPNPNEDWDTLIEKVSRDYVTFGGFCFQVILNENGKSVSLFHTFRFGKPKIENSYLSSKIFTQHFHKSRIGFERRIFFVFLY